MLDLAEVVARRRQRHVLEAGMLPLGLDLEERFRPEDAVRRLAPPQHESSVDAGGGPRARARLPRQWDAELDGRSFHGGSIRTDHGAGERDLRLVPRKHGHLSRRRERSDRQCEGREHARVNERIDGVRGSATCRPMSRNPALAESAFVAPFDPRAYDPRVPRSFVPHATSEP